MLFCDLVGSTELAGRMDPEEWGAALARYHARATEIVDALGGYVAQYLGDGVLAYFGWPTAHEDTAEHAVRAGLELVETIPRLHAGTEPLRVRVGIHTGAVVVSAVGAGSEMLALGGAPNVAARVQSLASVGTVLITEATLRLVAGAFVVESAGTHALKGVREPMAVHRALASSGVRSRRFQSSAGGPTPFVGRSGELAALTARWRQVCAGEGQLVVLTGEAGIGKSRLLRALRDEIRPDPGAWVESATSAYHENTPFFPIVEMLRRLAGGASETERLDALGAALARGGLAADDAVPLVAPLVGLDTPDASSVPASPDERHRRLSAMLVAWVQGLAREAPIAVVVEDLHWADPSTLELLQILADRIGTVRVLLVVTARPEFRPSWTPRSHHATIVLGRLPRHESRALVEAVAGRLARELVDVVVERTDGIPLFLEELARLVTEAGESPDAHAIPSTLSDSLMARLDRLGPAKEVAQIGAVIGRQFPYRLVRTILTIPDDELRARLDRLSASKLVHARGEPPHATYRFKHALVQDAAYASLLRGRRRELHRAIAAALLAEPTTPAEILARHHMEAGDHDAAAAAWQQAGERTAARGALGEAASHYQSALRALDTLTDGPERAARELPMRVALGQALFARKGYGSPEVAAEFARAKTLAAAAGNPLLTLPVLIGLFVWTLTRTDMVTARELADDMTAAAEGIGHRAAFAWAHWAQGAARYGVGQFADAARCLARALESYEEEDHRGRPTDPGMSSSALAGLTAWRLGLADTARTHMTNARALSERLNKTYSIVFAKGYTLILYAALGDAKSVAMMASEVETLARENRFPVFETTAVICGTWADATGHGNTAGLSRQRDAVAAYAAMGQRHMLGFYQRLLAETEAAAGEVERALATVEHSLEDGCESIDRPATLCVYGDLLARVGNDQDAGAAHYREAIAAARVFGARSDELRASVALARWLTSRGETRAARELLAPLETTFVEGRDTPDVQAAHRLLTELA